MAVDFEMYSGEQIEVTITVQDEDGNEITLTNYEAKWKMIAGDTTVSRSTPDTITISGSDIIFTLYPEDTVNIPPRRATYQHEASVRAPGSAINTVLRGEVDIKTSLVNDLWS